MSTTTPTEENVISLLSGSKGFVISADSVDARGAVTQEKLSGKRMVVHTRKNQSLPCTVNGKTLKRGESIWIPAEKSLASCFAKFDGRAVLIDMASEGYVCVDFDVLYQFTEIKMNKDAPMKEASFSVPVKKSAAVILNGAPLSEKLYELRKDKHYFNKDIKLSEWMYLVHEDGSFTDIVFPVDSDSVTLSEGQKNGNASQILTNPVTVYLKKGFRGVPNLLDGLRATCDIPSITHNGSDRVVKKQYKIQHYSGEVDVNFELVFLSEMESRVLDIHEVLVHDLQDFTVRYALYGMYFKVEEDQKTDFKPTQYFTKLTVFTADDTPVTSYVTREVKIYEKVNGGVIRKMLPEHTKTNKFFIVNDAFYKTSTDRVNQPVENGSTFAIYNESTSTWTSYTKRGEILFNTSYLVNLVDEKENEFNLRNVGVWDQTEAVSFQIEDKDVLPTLKLKSGELDKDLKLTVKFDDCQQVCTIRFQLNSLVRVSLLIDGEEDFSSSYARRASFYKSDGQESERLWSYGRFFGQIGEPIHAYGMTVKLDSNGVCTPVMSKYPVIDHSSERTCKLVKSMKYVAELLGEDKVIELGKDDVYLRVNACTDVEFKNSTITIPASTGTCFFVAGDTFHVYRSGLLRKRSGGFSSPGSTVTSPKGTFNGLKPSAEPFIETGAFSEVVTTGAPAAKSSKTPVLAKPALGARKAEEISVVNALVNVGKATVDASVSVVKSVAENTMKIGESVVAVGAAAVAAVSSKQQKIPVVVNNIKGFGGRRSVKATVAAIAAAAVVEAITESAPAKVESASVVQTSETSEISPPVKPKRSLFSGKASIELYA